MNTSSNSVETVTRNFLMLGMGEITARVITFLTMLYIARKVGVTAYGTIGFAYAVILYFARVTDFGIETLGPREIAEDNHRIDTMGPSVLIARLVIAALSAALLIAVGVLALPQPDDWVLGLFGLTLFAVGGSTRWIHVGLESTGFVALGRTVGEIVRALLVLALVHSAADVVDVPLAQFVGDTLTALVLFMTLRWKGWLQSWHFDRAVVGDVFRKAWPLMVTPLLGLVIYNSDLLWLRLFRDLREIGYYLAAYTLITFMANLAMAYGTSLLPTFTRLAKVAQRQHELYHTSIARVFAVGLPIALGGYLLAPDIIRVGFGETYAPAVPGLKALIWCVPLFLLRSVLQTVLISAGRQDRVLRMTVWGTAFNLVTNLLFIPRYGMIGAALTALATELLRWIFAQVYVAAEGYSLTGFTRFWRTLSAALAMLVALLIARPSSLWVALPLGIAGYGMALLVTGGIRFRRGKFPSLTV